ncbi:MAG: acetate--CoA ligase family protein [Candidatus Odinarchaeia archaeon]
MQASHIINNAISNGRKYLLEHESKELLTLFTIPTTKWAVAKSCEEAVEKSREIGFPLVMKVLSPDILHKTDVGGVKLNIQNESEVKKAFNEIISNVKNKKPDADILGVLLDSFAEKGFELIVGALKSPEFDQTVMVGAGGIFTELFKDVCFRVAPLTHNEAKEMLQELKIYPLFKGFRGQTLDENAIVDIIVKVSNLIMELPQISQMDLNPVILYHQGAIVVDAKIILSNK